jgi:hypothetical protein
MIIYQPFISSSDRVLWHGGQSTQIHYQKLNPEGEWWDRDVRTLGSGIPSGMSEMHAEMVDYYNYCQTAEHI